MDAQCQKCQRTIPKRRLQNGARVGAVVAYCSNRCQAAARQARHRQRAPKRRQDRIHLRNLAAHGMIAEKLLRDPTIIEVARHNINCWIERNGPMPALEEWRSILDEGQDAVLAALLLVTETGMRLRSSSPFAGILTERERSLIFRGERD